MSKNEQKTEKLRFDKKDLERLARLRLLDDDFMTKVFEDKECAEILLQIILDRKDLKVLRVQVQYTVKNLQGRSVRLDILAVDETGKIYDIEIQRDDKGAGTKRARYNSSILDANITEPGEEFEKLPETYVIFITENDVLGGNLPIYHIDRTIQESKELFQDESHIIYVNSQITDETELGKLMQDFRCTNAKDMNNPVLAKRVSYFKENQEGVAVMCKEMELMREEVREETTKKVREETTKKVREETTKKAIRNMLTGPFTKEQIKLALNVTDADIQKVEEELLVHN
ncbi:MAG: Rpn family recombination-promoting nuclease/putative transposase [Dorea formicigenerans]